MLPAISHNYNKGMTKTPVMTKVVESQQNPGGGGTFYRPLCQHLVSVIQHETDMLFMSDSMENSWHGIHTTTVEQMTMHTMPQATL